MMPGMGQVTYNAAGGSACTGEYGWDGTLEDRWTSDYPSPIALKVSDLCDVAHWKFKTYFVEFDESKAVFTPENNSGTFGDTTWN